MIKWQIIDKDTAGISRTELPDKHIVVYLSYNVAKLVETIRVMIGMDIFILIMEKLMRQKTTSVYIFLKDFQFLEFFDTTQQI